MIYCCGDIHGFLDIKKIEYWEKEKSPTDKDILIILGDFGGIWYGNHWDNGIIDYWAAKPYKIFFIDGNHENHPAIAKFPIVKIYGGRANQIATNIFHLMRGEIFIIEGKTFFVMGGASSVDKYLRQEGKSWWPEEMPNNEEYENGLDNLAKVGWEVDYILTHCTDSYTLKLIDPYFEKDELTQYLSILKFQYNLKYKHHYFGHYHIDREILPTETCLYDYIITIKD